LIRRAIVVTISVSELEISKGTKTRRHNHADEELFLLLGGEVWAIGAETSSVLSPGDVFSVHPSYD